jgi:hypothetical protein
MTTTRQSTRLREVAEDTSSTSNLTINAEESEVEEEGEDGCDDEIQEVLTPLRKRRKRNLERNIQRTAVQELLNVRASNGGKKKRGDIKLICENYNKDGYECVTRRSVEHILSTMKKKGKSLSSVMDGDTQPLMSVAGNIFYVENDISDLTDEAAGTSTDIFVPEAAVDDRPGNSIDGDTISEASQSKKQPGRKKGTTKAAHKLYVQTLKTAITEAASEYQNMKTEFESFEGVGELRKRTGKTPNGALDLLVASVEKKYKLDPNSINRHTVKTIQFMIYSITSMMISN